MLKVQNIAFQYSKTDSVFKDLSFEVSPGEIIALVGPSGSGKTTLLKLIYGLLALNEGSISWNDQVVPHPSDVLIPGEKTMKLVEQNFNLMPFTNVYENILHHVLHIHDDDRQPILDYWLDFLKITDIENKKASDLSGGQMQRVAMAKSLISKPELILLDEPFSNLDTLTKSHLISDLKTHLRKTGTTAIVVIHQPDDALEIADKIMVLNESTIHQYDDPQTVYHKPSTKLVAGLFGVSNFLSEDVFQKTLNLDITRFHLVEKSIMVRSHELSLSNLKGDVEILDELFLGHRTLLKVKTAHQIIWLNK